jgi:hypothetical protein
MKSELRIEAERQVSGLSEQYAKMFVDGRDMYYALQHHRKYRGKSIVFPTNQQYKDLAKMLDLPVSYVRKRVELFLHG